MFRVLNHLEEADGACVGPNAEIVHEVSAAKPIIRGLDHSELLCKLSRSVRLIGVGEHTQGRRASTYEEGTAFYYLGLYNLETYGGILTT